MEFNTEEAKFLDMVVAVFLKQLETTESFLQGADLSDAKMQGLALRKKLRTVKPPEPTKADPKKEG